MTAARLVASALGIGFVRTAPGTAGSAAALLLGAVFLAVNPATIPVAAALATLLGLATIPAAIRGSDIKDPGWVVIDEVAGQLLALLPLSRPSPAGLLLAFAAFRLFDIAKPGPIGWADRQPGPAGIMADDLLAGLAAAGVVLVGHILGAQWV